MIYLSFVCVNTWYYWVSKLGSWVTLIFFFNPENIFETFPNPEILRDASHLTRT